MPAAAIVTLLIMGGFYFWLFIADDMQPSADSAATKTEDASQAGAQIFFAMTDANLRDRPTTTGSNILGKLPRGSQVTGTIQPGSGSDGGWLELSDGNGFVALINLSQNKPPVLTKSLNDQSWAADGLIDVWATTLPDSDLLDRVREGTKLTLVGTTADNFIEVKLDGGRYGYLADATSILARLGGKPISIGFNPQTCAFAGEIGAEFAKIGAQLQAQWQALEAKDFADETAREKAYAAIEGKSKFVRLRRSFEGLSLTGLAQHYESQSLYFDDPPAKVIEVFRGQGFNIGRDGLFQSTELYAGITATRGEVAAYGKTELGCGV
ncbi:SH3 domain-containing protein [Sphingorhabdus sp.]|uniref:SH3 domain-containing protein n=1 Tax=Sphingorhabdus sp. TaxID=1902408 RepID=UPI00391892F7